MEKFYFTQIQDFLEMYIILVYTSIRKIDNGYMKICVSFTECNSPSIEISYYQSEPLISSDYEEISKNKFIEEFNMAKYIINKINI